MLIGFFCVLILILKDFVGVWSGKCVVVMSLDGFIMMNWRCNVSG